MSNDRFHLAIISPEKIVFEGEATLLTLPGKSGSFTILAHHAPIVASLKAGALVYKTDEAEHTLEVKSGFIEMSHNDVSVCIA
ncbi:MAG: F0F1 ATP synthase subunit epsilon [Prevotellaceae bacterium]|jgi:F-type H+-transporting ATPase subunit epsilon|nr:F0F1 ATP synthase subunit epsilon [Prevotellaceae bacterium]